MSLLAVYLHDINPFVIRFSGNFGIRWYGLSYLLGFIVAYLLVRHVVRLGRSPLRPVHVADMVLWLAIGVMIGGRLGYVVLYDLLPSLMDHTTPLLWSFSSAFPYWGVLAINHGGMASHGGIIGAILASLLYARRQRVAWAHILDLAAFGTPIGLFFGRIANFINGELFGRPCPPDFRFAVKFPQEMITWLPTINHSADPRLEQLRPALEFLPATSYPTEGVNGIPGQHVALNGDALAAIVDAVQRGNSRVIAVVEPLLTPRHPSQIYQALLEGLTLMLVLLIVWRRPRKPMVLAGWFCLAYGLLRIVGEIYRTPDAQIASQEFAHFGITRGQWLSALTSLAGLAMVLFAARRNTAPLGGWRRN